MFRLQPGKLDSVIDAAENAPDRRMRCEAVIGLNIVLGLGTPEEKQRASEVLTELTADADPKVADAARWSLDNPVDLEVLERVGMVNPRKK